MADGLFGVVWHERLQLSLRAFMIQESLPRIAEYRRELRPGIRSGHVDNSHGFDPGFWRFDAQETRGLAALDAAPELAFGSDNEVLIERISMGGRVLKFLAATQS